MSGVLWLVGGLVVVTLGVACLFYSGASLERQSVALGASWLLGGLVVIALGVACFFYGGSLLDRQSMARKKREPWPRTDVTREP